MAKHRYSDQKRRRELARADRRDKKEQNRRLTWQEKFEAREREEARA